jgi:hypothetical protein
MLNIPVDNIVITCTFFVEKKTVEEYLCLSTGFPVLK